MPPALSEKNFEATIEQVLTQALPAPGPATARQKKGPVPGRSSGFPSCCARLGLGGLDNSSSSEGAAVRSLGRQPQDPGETTKDAFSSPIGAARASRGRALLSPDWGSEQGTGRLGTSWGLRLQATNFRRYAARENPVICNP